MMSKKLRVLHVVLHPVLVWDDGEELKILDQQVNPIQVTLSELKELENKFKNEVKEIEKQLIEKGL